MLLLFQVMKLLNDSKRIQKIIDGIPGFKNQPILTGEWFCYALVLGHFRHAGRTYAFSY